MKKLLFITLVMIWSISVVNANGLLNGTWDDMKNYGLGWRFFNENWERRISGNLHNRGTYVIYGNTITMSVTHVRLGRSWLTRPQMRAAYIEDKSFMYWLTMESIDERLESVFGRLTTYTFSVNHSTLALYRHFNWDDDIITSTLPSIYAIRW